MNVALRPEHLNILSICTGGAGLDLGFELAVPGATSVCMVEREAFAVAQLVSAMEAGLMAPAPIWSDARTFAGRAWRGAVDGLIGGIPCQPHSLAGRKRGQHDERDLWSDARRIIVQSRVWFVVIENVSGMLSAGDDKIAGAERVHRDLHKLGFSVEGGLFTASEVGATHQRERVFILAVANGYGQYDNGARIVRQGRGRQSADGGIGLADAVSGLEGSDGREVRKQQQTFERGGEGLVHAQGVRRRKGRPKSIVRSGRDALASTSEPMGNSSIARGGRVPVQPRRQDEARPDFDRPSLFPPGPNDIDLWRSALAASPELEPAFRRVADGLASRMDIGRVDRLRMLGNGVVPLQAAYAIRTLATRLAAKGSAGAARLVRLMELS